MKTSVPHKFLSKFLAGSAALLTIAAQAEDFEIKFASFEAPALVDPTMDDFLAASGKRALHPLDPRPGKTLFEALWDGDPGKFFEALRGGESPDGTDALGDTILCAAIRAGNEMAVAWLLDAGASTELCGFEGQPPLWVAFLHGQTGVLKVMLERGVSPDTRHYGPLEPGTGPAVSDRILGLALKNDDGLTLLMAAAASGDLDLMRLLLSYHAKTLLYTGKFSRYAINYAAMNGHIEAMQLLLGYEPSEGTEVIVDLKKQVAVYFKNGEEQFKASISSGRKGFATPTGTFVITNKYKNWTSTIYDASMPYFQRFSCGDFGFHAGSLPGYPASHGCIRLSSANAKKFYSTIPLGTKVRIIATSGE